MPPLAISGTGQCPNGLSCWPWKERDCLCRHEHLPPNHHNTTTCTRLCVRPPSVCRVSYPTWPAAQPAACTTLLLLSRPDLQVCLPSTWRQQHGGVCGRVSSISLSVSDLQRDVHGWRIAHRGPSIWLSFCSPLGAGLRVYGPSSPSQLTNQAWCGGGGYRGG